MNAMPQRFDCTNRTDRGERHEKRDRRGMSGERQAAADGGEARPEFGFFETLLANLGSGSVQPPRVPARERQDDPPGNRTLHAEIARTPAHLAEASALVERRYASRGYATEPAVPVSRLDRRAAATLVALRGGIVVGTMTLGFDGPAGLWIDETYAAAIRHRRDAGRRVCEITRLAIASRQGTGSALAAMFALAYRLGRTDRLATDLYVEVHPRHARLYQRLFGFVAASDVRECGRVKAPSILLHLDIERLDERMAAHFARRAAGIPGITA